MTNDKMSTLLKISCQIAIAEDSAVLGDILF